MKIAIYVHWPFCESKCPYCDFNSHVRDRVDENTFLKCYIKEIEQHREYLRDKEVVSIFFGGGTPSLASAATIETIIKAFSNFAKFDPNIEITLEANPGSSEIVKFRDFANAGVNRLSIGIQSFNDAALQFLGRKHSAYAAYRAIEYADQTFNNYSFDMIYALPYHNLENWHEELCHALKYAKYHISLYQLTLEKGTAFYRDHQQGNLTIIDNDRAADLYEMTNVILEERSFNAYEVSNYAKESYQCKHNMVYWRYGDYLGIGAGAHSRITKDGKKFALMNVHAPEKWMNLILQDASPVQNIKELTTIEKVEEMLIMGLRLSSGVRLKDLSIEQQPEFRQRLMELEQHGLIVLSNDCIITTSAGRMVLNSIIQSLLA